MRHEVEHHTEEDLRQHHHGQPQQQHRAPAHTVDHPHANQRGDHRDNAVANGCDQRGVDAHPRLFEDHRRVVHERIDAGELDHESQADADGQQLEQPGLIEGREHT
ncbi:hypothetical protein D3C85_976910 [compost metagenome]